MLLTALFALASAAPEWVWIESETGVQAPAVRSTIRPDLLSGGSGLEVLGPKANLAAETTFSYSFRVATAGDYRVWHRLGFEFVRSEFDWRVGDGEWKTVSPNDLTIDLVPLAEWNELGWLDQGAVNLAAGDHRLQIRLRKEKIAGDNVAYRSDAFCVTSGDFRPNFKLRPDQDHRTDRDRAAAQWVFQAPAAPDAGRTRIELGGDWEMARWDERQPSSSERLQPVQALPKLDELPWYAVKAPGGKAADRPEFAFAHRFLYRTRVNVPATPNPKGFVLDFENTSMFTSVFVNGKLCGTSKVFHAGWTCDITEAVRPGQVNEVVLAFKDAYYAFDPDQDPIGVRRYFNMPYNWLGKNEIEPGLGRQHVTNLLDVPVSSGTASGILEPVSWVTAGRQFVQDAFVRTSVQNGEIAVDLELRNPDSSPRTVRPRLQVSESANGPAVVSFDGEPVIIPANGVAKTTVRREWKDAKLWWPQTPNLYHLTTTLEIAGAPVDRHNVRFGFREWTWPDHRLYLNGVRWQIYTDLLYGDTPDATAELYKKTEQQGIRFYSGWYNPPFLLTQRQWLNRADELGFLVRSSGTGDGQVGQYTLVKEGKVDPEWAEHWLIQLEGWIRAQRNHPSIHLWTLENEIVYINSMNWGRGDIFEPLVTQASQLVSRLDPTRPNMVDGGRALKDMSLPVNGAHYNEMAPGMELRDYPDIAYNAREFWAKNLERGRWPLAAKKPTFHGESFFSEGYSPADLAQIGGEKCFLGRGYTAEAIGTFARMLNEGWRWNDVAGAHHWFRGGKGLHVNAGRPISIGERVWSRTWPTGRPISLPMKLYNQTPSAEPITVRWSLAAGSQSFGSGEQTFSIRPGEEASFTPTLGPLSATSRVDAVWTLTAHRAGREVYREQRPISVLPDPIPRRQNRPRVTVIDPEGSVIRWLQREGRPFQSVPSLADLTRPDRVVLIGRGVLKAEDSANPALLRLAAQGHRVVVLEQDHPLRYAGLPTDAEPSAFDGRIAFLENPSHPILAGLQDSDLFCPTDDHLAYRRAYRKPTRSARSLVQCDRQLNYSALLECPVDDGLLILCQLTVASKLGQAPFASRALANMLDYAQSYQRRVQPVSSLLATQDTRTAMLRRAGLSPQPATGLPKAGIAVVDGGKESLAKIGPGAARKFAESGGTLVVWGVTPESLPEFNRMVGVEHLIRPFEMERVEVGLPRDPLAAGMSQRDVTIQSADSMFGWANYPWPDRDVFTFVVDAGPDLAPFLRFPSLESLGRTTIADRPQDTRTYNDGWPRNMVNGFNSADGWTLAYTTAKGQRFEFGVPAARRLSEFSIQFNDTFNRVTRLNLYVDGDPNPIVFRPEPGVDRQDFGIDPPRSVTEKLVLEIAEIEKTKDNELVGIDNLWLGVARPPATTAAVKPLLNVGGLVRYPVGKGQIVLCQLKVMEREPNPVNTDKKTALVRTLFDNLRADFGGLRTIVPGAELAYAPVPFPVGKANAYLRGTPPQPWFDQTDFSAFPTGNQVLAQVPFVVNDFRTSPVPGAIMLKGPGSAADVDEVSGLTVGQAADALFFLHAFRADDRFRNLRDDAPPPVAFAYRVRYQDGEEVTVPVVLGRGVAHWRQPNPQPLPEASLAWSGPVAGGEPGAVYLFQWNNPRPKVPIASVTLANAPGDERPGSPALLGITAARRP